MPPPPAVEEEAAPISIPPRMENAPWTGPLRGSVGVDGALVYVEGTEVGPAAHEVSSTRIGGHEVKVTQEATVDEVEIVRTYDGRRAEVVASLELPPAIPRITSAVPDAVDYIKTHLNLEVREGKNYNLPKLALTPTCSSSFTETFKKLSRG